MHDLLLAAIMISISAMLFEGYIVFRNLKNKLHAYLFLNCIVMLVNNTGYLLQLLSKTEDAYVAALKFSYAGRVWILFSLFMFSVELMHKKIPKAVVNSFILIDLAVYACIFTLPDHKLYYSKTWFDKSGIFPVLLHRNGIVHNLFMIFQTVIIIVILFWLIRSIKDHKGRTAKKRVWIILGGFITAASLYLIQITHVFFVTYFFDFTTLGNVAVTISMFIAIFRYNLLGIIDLAREYIVDRLSEGVIAIAPDGRVEYYNEHVKELYPDISKDPEEVVRKLSVAIENGDTLMIGDRYYSPEQKELSADGEIIGILYALVDTTVLKQKEYKLKSEAAVLEIAANSMRERLTAAEELMAQDRTMRHDRRHFEALLLSLIRDGKVDEAGKCLEERLLQEPHSVHRYCENTTVNAALTHCVTMADRDDIKVTISANIPVDPGVDEMQLAIAISNLFENAVHACRKVPKDDRYIEITARFKEQLLFEIVNSCDKKAVLDEEGHPVTTKEGHGIGTKSVLDFVNKTDSQILYTAEDNRFRVRIITG